MKIYTKTGDKGTTSLIGGTRVSKSHERINAYGTMDELNSWIGLIRDQFDTECHMLERIQNELFVYGSLLAAEDFANADYLPKPDPEMVVDLEKRIDEMDAVLEPLKNFIIPGGHPIVSQTHIARCVCRRGERLVVELSAHEIIPEPCIIFLNRLSDYLFTLSRFMARELGVIEHTWNPKKKKKEDEK